MTEANEQGQPLGLASTAELGLVERLRQRGNDLRSHPVANGTIDRTEEAGELLIEAAAELQVYALQRANLRDALVKVLDARNREAKAGMSYRNACESFTSSAMELRQYERAMLAASAAEQEARTLLLTLRVRA